jgi:hypothetical protein
VRIVFNKMYVTQCCLMYCTDTWNLLPPSSLMMESSSSECQYTCTWTTWQHISEDRELYIYCCDSTKSYTIINEILYALFVVMWKQWIATRLRPVMGFYIIVSLFYLTIVICHFMALIHHLCGQSADWTTLTCQMSS